MLYDRCDQSNLFKCHCHISDSKRQRTSTDQKADENIGNIEDRMSTPPKLEQQLPISERPCRVTTPDSARDSPITLHSESTDPDVHRSRSKQPDWYANSPPSSPLSPDDEHNRRAPLETLRRIFPHMKQSVLQLIMQGCNNDIVQAIEQILNNHNSQPALPSSSTSTGSGSMVTHRPYLTSAAAAAVATSGINGLKSAFSPITTLAAPHSAHVSPLRYAYATAASNARGLAFAMPYPPGFFPNLASMGYNYNSLTNSQKNSMHYAMCPCTPYSSDSTDKQT